jgi:hypothetical protein
LFDLAGEHFNAEAKDPRIGAGRHLGRHGSQLEEIPPRAGGNLAAAQARSDYYRFASYVLSGNKKAHPCRGGLSSF